MIKSIIKKFSFICVALPFYSIAQSADNQSTIFETASYSTGENAAVQMVRFDPIYFKCDSTAIDSKYWSSLDYLHHWLKINSDTQIELHGHTNGIPSHNYCKNLSQKRAESVKAYLIKKGIPSAQIICKADGKNKLLVKSNAKKDKHWNQRVEIKISGFNI